MVKKDERPSNAATGLSPSERVIMTLLFLPERVGEEGCSGTVKVVAGLVNMERMVVRGERLSVGGR